MSLGTGGGRRSAFTIVEVLMVVAIMTLLFGLVMFATTSVRKTAMKKATEALINRVRDRIEEYHSLTGSYPPDGYDTEVKNKQGTRLWGSAALYDALTTELTIEEKVSGQVRTRTNPPLMVFKQVEMSKENEDFPGAFEILDGFGLPVHYDNTQDGKFDPRKQTDNAHLDAVEDHPADPRTDPEIVRKTGVQRNGAYDLWSHGTTRGHDPNASLKYTIGTWNVDVDKDMSKEEEEGR